MRWYRFSSQVVWIRFIFSGKNSIRLDWLHLGVPSAIVQLPTQDGLTVHRIEEELIENHWKPGHTWIFLKPGHIWIFAKWWLLFTIGTHGLRWNCTGPTRNFPLLEKRPFFNLDQIWTTVPVTGSRIYSSETSFTAQSHLCIKAKLNLRLSQNGNFSLFLKTLPEKNQSSKKSLQVQMLSFPDYIKTFSLWNISIFRSQSPTSFNQRAVPLNRGKFPTAHLY